MLAQTHDGKLDFAQYAVTFNHLGSFQTHYENDLSYWLEFVSRWPDVQNFESNPVTPTTEQIARLEQVKPTINTPELVTRWLSELSDYVEYGAVEPESLCPALAAMKSTTAATNGLMAKYRAQRLTELATHRYAIETQGTTLPSGAKIATNRAHQAQLSSVFVTLNAGLVPTVSFKSPEGFAVATLETLSPIYQAVVAHVQKAFSTEAVVDQAIRTATDLEVLKTMDVKAAFTAAWKV
jgi:hypothetical protein